MPGGRPTAYLPEYCNQLIEHMSMGFSFPSFAGRIRVSIDTIYEWAKIHSEFSEAKSIGKSLELIWWEKILRGGASGRISNYNATSTIFALKNKAPKYYRDRIQVDANHSMDNTKEGLKKLLDSPKHREAAKMVAEALALEKTKDEPGE
jgi:hypothetical protein